MQKRKKVITVKEDTAIGNGIILEKGDKIQVLTRKPMKEEFIEIMMDRNNNLTGYLDAAVELVSKWKRDTKDNYGSDYDVFKDDAYEEVERAFNRALSEVRDILR